MAGNALLGLHDIFPWWTPDVPDLGCFVSRKHELESYDWNIWNEFSPWNAGGIITHQTYARVLCGEAAFYQRARVVMLGPSSDPFQANAAVPDYVLGGNHVPYPSDWVKFPVQSQERLYWFIGEYRNPATTTWRADARVGHTFDIYDNGTLSTVKFDDTGGDMDQDDFILEVAVVRRRLWFDAIEVASAEGARFDEGKFREIFERSRSDRQVAEPAETRG